MEHKIFNELFIAKVTRGRNNFTQREITEFCRAYRKLDQNTLYTLKMIVRASLGTKKREATNLFRFATDNYAVNIVPKLYVGERKELSASPEPAVKLRFVSLKNSCGFGDFLVNYNAMTCEDIIKHIYEALISLEHLDNAFKGTHDIECEIRERKDAKDELIPNQICLHFNFNFGQNLALQTGFETAIRKRINLAKYCDGTSTSCGDVIAFFSTKPTKRELDNIKARAIEGAVKFIGSLGKKDKKEIRWF
jgi:hypothetical protein